MFEYTYSILTNNYNKNIKNIIKKIIIKFTEKYHNKIKLILIEKLHQMYSYLMNIKKPMKRPQLRFFDFIGCLKRQKDDLKEISGYRT